MKNKSFKVYRIKNNEVQEAEGCGMVFWRHSDVINFAQ